MDIMIIKDKLKNMEDDLLRVGGSTSWWWMGIALRWVCGNKSQGFGMKRGNSYGVIKYFNTLGNFNEEEKEITRDEAISEISKPWELRRAIQDAGNITKCHICGKTAFGFDEIENWHHIYRRKIVNHTTQIDYDFWICNKCIDVIFNKSNLP